MEKEKQTAEEVKKPATTKKPTTAKPEANTQPPRKKTLFEKIQRVRVGLQKTEVKKSGKMNVRESKPYLELADFTPQLNDLMLAERFTAIINFTPENATLTAYDFDSDQTFTITSPMREVKVSGCNDMQNLGAVETYQRRYLYMAMFDIAESDMLDGDSGNGSNDDSGNGKPKADKLFEKPTLDQLKEIQDLHIDINNIAAHFKKSVDEIGKDEVAEAIKLQKAAIAKVEAKRSAQQQAAQKQAAQQQADNTEGKA
jgi:hypothetical protein